ncbi:hypothetical protein [Bradyrhizobium sp. DOA1]|uniref:hypothetical protein n=1 Tax=Bradyrhizobium sp. DOA1 TaxID=1126616 RepID=UPI00077C5643|nr:hypothetical protein [Bradyrhizobium sp. DOA1]KYH03558.1 hypothetical protein SE91_28060 [Bradyrhizobium sp. DOA1]
MKPCRLLLLALCIAGVAPAQAVDLTGGWVIDFANCNKVFSKENGKLAFKPDADLYAGGLIVDGRRITGTFQKCNVRSVRDDGENMQVVAACSDGIVVSDVTFDLTMSGDNKLTLSSKQPTPVEMRYSRCPL